MTKTIEWGDGSGDKITLTYDAASGNQNVAVSSDPNNGSTSRTKTITFKTGTGNVSRTLSVTQLSNAKKEYTVTLYPSAFLSGQYASITGQNNPVGKGSTSTSYVTINLKTGSRAETWAYYTVDTSSIPADAEIVEVTCSAKCYISTTTTNRVGTRQLQLFTGTTAKGTAGTVSTSTTAFNVTAGTWTRSELNNMRVRVYGVRGTSNTSTTYYFRFYGATITIKYKA